MRERHHFIIRAQDEYAVEQVIRVELHEGQPPDLFMRPFGWEGAPWTRLEELP